MKAHSALVLLAACAIAAALVHPTAAQSNSSAFVSVGPDHRFIGPDGRTLIFHGINVVYKTFPYYPNLATFDPVTSFTDQDIDNLVSWGFNFVRLGLIWSGVEPAPGQYNQTYLLVLKGIVDKLHQRGIYTLLDNHQDVLSPKFCGEGVADFLVQPRHAASSFPFPVPANLTKDPATGYPLITDCLKHNFGEYYVASEVGSAFQSFYDNYNGLADKMADFWKVVATAFSDSPGLIGYELWNEPWIGYLEGNPRLIEPGYADLHNLAPLYEKLHASIRAVDTQHLVFYEAVQTDAFFKCGYQHAPGGAEWANKTVYSYHIYCPDLNKEGDPNSGTVCLAFDDAKMVDCVNDGVRLGGGLFLTEFGAVSGAPAGVEEITRITGLADAYLQSWSYWQYKYYNDVTTQSAAESLFTSNGTLDTGKVKVLARTYAPIIQGTATKMNFDGNSGNFELAFNLDKSLPGTTEIYLNAKLWYPKGFTVGILPTDSATYSFDPVAGRIYVTANSTTAQSLNIRVQIAPKL